MKGSTSYKSLRPFGWCAVLLVLGSILSGCAFTNEVITDLFPNDGCISGNCQNGQGTFKYFGAGQYVGWWRAGVRNGQGTQTNANGSQQYVGEWRDNKKNGLGTETSANGSQYVGEWRDNERSGQGTITHANGSQYVGEWRDNKQHGQGTLTLADGSITRGRWDNNFLVEIQYDPPQSQAPERVADDQEPDGPPQYQAPELVADNQEPIEAWSGSGFFVSRDGHVLTNQHVIDSCQDVQLHSKGTRYSVAVIATDRVNDIALLKADLTPPAVFPLSQDNPYLLQNIYAAGYPFGNDVSAAVKVTSGIVSSLVGIGDNVSNLQIDAALQPGNSGGPIVDEYGNAIGIAVAKLDLALFMEAYQVVPENVNFGIRSSVAASLLDANNVEATQPSNSTISQEELGRRITDGTVILSCWMTASRIEEMRSRKVLFEGL